MNTIKRYFSTESNVKTESKLRSKIGPYLAGLIEADGSIAVHDKDSNAQKYRPKILVVFSLADKPLANKLASITNAGAVYVKKNTGYVLWQIQKIEDVIKIINIINGYMRTPKIEALHRAINWFNEFYNYSIDCLGLDLSPIDSNAWLAGFTTSNSSFIISAPHTRVLKYKLLVNFVTPNNEREEWYSSVYFLLFSKISEYLNTSFISKTKHSNNIKYTFIIFVYLPQSQERLIKYFSEFPLLGKIYQDYEHWCEILSNKYNTKVVGKFKGVENLKIQLQNRQPMLGSKLCNSLTNLSQKRNLSTSSILQGKIKSIIPTSTCTDLVIWENNLPSGVGWGRHTKQERNMIAIPPYQYSVIVGLLLSDGWLIIPGTTHISPRLGLSQSLSHFKYVWFVFNALSHYCENFPVLRERKRGKKHTDVLM